MPQVKMNCVLSGGKTVVEPGDIISVDAKEAERLVAAGAGVIIEDAKPAKPAKDA